MASPTRAISGDRGRRVPVPLQSHAQGGFTYLMLLLWVVLAGVMLAALGTSWHLMSRREREAELLWRGEQYKKALASYAQAGAKLQIAAAEAASAAAANATMQVPASGDLGQGQAVQGQAGQPAAQQGAQAIAPISGPLELKDLLEDRRSGKVQRHLRRLYSDPITGSPRWGLLRSVDGRIAGVYSLSEAEPVRVGLGVQHYRELVFGNAGAAAAASSAASTASTAATASGAPAGSGAATEPGRTGKLPWLNYGLNGSPK